LILVKIPYSLQQGYNYLIVQPAKPFSTKIALRQSSLYIIVHNWRDDRFEPNKTSTNAPKSSQHTDTEAALMFLAPTPYLALLASIIIMLVITFFVILRRSDA